MRYIHHIVTQENRDVTNTETVYTNSNTPKSSFKMILQMKSGVQYEVIDRKTNQVTIIGVSLF